MNMLPEPLNGNDEKPRESAGDGLTGSGRRLPLLSVAATVLVLAGLALLALSLSGGNTSPLYPILPTVTPPATMAQEPEEIGFAELNADPAAFLGHRLQVSGDYTPLERPECLNFTGPKINWSLVAEELQLNATGFEPLLRLLEPGTPMTVTGFWQAYQGPLGCGKEPDDGTVWYLAVDRILEPNPIRGAPGPQLTVIPGAGLPTLAMEATLGTGTPTVELTPTLTESLTLTVTLNAATPSGLTPSPNVTTPPVTPLVTAGSPAGTPPPGITPVTTPLEGSTPTPTATGGTPGTTTPGLPTNTPAGTGYPPAQTSPTPTSPNPYP